MRNILILLLLFICVQTSAQEFNISVSVNARQLEGTDQRVFQSLQTAISEFINQQNWTSFQYKPEERIEGTMMITLTDRLSSDEFKGRINVILRRPVFRTNYNTVLFNWVDREFHIKYVEHQPLEFSDNTHTSNLTSILAYYAYLFLGLDGDSFSRFGGTPYYEKAMSIVTAAQNAPERGWKSFESQRNRYWVMENLLNGSYAPIREAMYVYHRRGFDVMSENIDLGRLAITESLELLQRAHRSRPGLFILQLFMEAKRDELVNIYKEAPQMEKPRAVNILKELDPAQSSNYDRILTSKE
jgi:hypothetical protein